MDSEKTLGQVAYEARYFGLWEVLQQRTQGEYERLADAVVAAHEEPPKEVERDG